MPDPVMLAVASALAAKAAEGLSEGGRAAFSALARLVRRRLRTEPDSESALEAVENRPDDEACVGRLATVLEALAHRDRLFAEELDRLWSGLRDQQAAGIGAGSGVVNQVNGTVGGPVVQARDVSGGISFGAPGAAS